MRAFVAHGMFLWERWQCVNFVQEYFMTLKEISDLIFVRGGMLRAATHLHGDRDGIPVLRVRPLTIHLSLSRHRRVCIALASIGMGLVTGASAGGRSSNPTWYLHDLATVLSGDVPRLSRRNLVFVSAAPLLPRAVALYRQMQDVVSTREPEEDSTGSES